MVLTQASLRTGEIILAYVDQPANQKIEAKAYDPTTSTWRLLGTP